MLLAMLASFPDIFLTFSGSLCTMIRFWVFVLSEMLSYLTHCGEIVCTFLFFYFFIFKIRECGDSSLPAWTCCKRLSENGCIVIQLTHMTFSSTMPTAAVLPSMDNGPTRGPQSSATVKPAWPYWHTVARCQTFPFCKTDFVRLSNVHLHHLRFPCFRSAGFC